jgi:hypothetical protein
MYARNDDNIHKPSTIFYWNGILDPSGLSSEYSETIEKIVNGNYQSTDFEKLLGHNVYSARINQSDRLLFTTIQVNGKPYLMLLDVVLNHDYAKSRFLKPAVLKHYIEFHGKAISEELIGNHFETLEGPPPVLLSNGETAQAFHYSRIDFYNHKFIELDADQLDAGTKATLPLIISGAPGSGKSCIALLLLGQFVESSFDKEDYPILYVTESEKLAVSMYQAWQALPIAQGLDSKSVLFKSYEQLIKELAPNTADKMFVGKEHCMYWLTTYIKETIKPHSKSKNKGNNFDNSFFTDKNRMYQEFRIISGCDDLEEYLSLGQRQSLFQGAHEKKWLFLAFNNYLKALEGHQSVHAPFYRLNRTDQFKRIVVDEAQDLSHLQLKTLSSLACNRQICYCEDNRQSLSDTKSKIPFLKKLMHSWGKEDNHINLLASYRCPAAVITMANAASSLKSIVTGEGQLEIALPDASTNQGTVTWFDALTDIQLSTLQHEALSPDFAIVTLEEYKKEAKKLFNTPFIFTTDEIKGLEFKKIMAYRLLDSPLFKEANKLLGESTSGAKKTGNRAKRNQGQEQFGPIFNNLYTAFTRATDTLYIYQERHHYLQNISNFLLQAVPKDKATSLLNEPTTTTTVFEECREEWFEQVKIQLGQGNDTVAKDIYLEKLNGTSVEFDEFSQYFKNPTTQKIPIDNNTTNDVSKLHHTPYNKPAQATPTTTTQVVAYPARCPDSKSNNSIATKRPNSNTSDEAIYKFLNNLLQNLNYSNLRKVLQHKNAKKYLFNYPFSDDGACLFNKLFYDAKKLEVLFKCLPEFNAVILDGLTTDVLCHMRPLSAMQFADCSPLYAFSSTPDGHELFNGLLNHSPRLVECICPKALCQPLTFKAGPFVNTSPFSNFTSSINGLEMLLKLLTLKPELAESISGTVLCLPRTRESGQHKNITPLYCLSRGPTGHKILSLLLEKNRELAASISYEALILPGGLYSTITPKRNFLQSPTGNEILTFLATNNPKIAHRLSCSSYTQSASSPYSLFARLNNVIEDRKGKEESNNKRHDL